MIIFGMHRPIFSRTEHRLDWELICFANEALSAVGLYHGDVFEWCKHALSQGCVECQRGSNDKVQGPGVGIKKRTKEGRR